jgi:hypothetical protein
VAFSPDGRRLASAGLDGTVRLWDAASGQELFTLQGHKGWVTGAAFSPDGRRLASAGGDGTVRLWDVAAGREVLTLQGHRAPVKGVAFSPDGRRLASAGADGTVRLWDAAGGQELLTLKGHTSFVVSVAWSPDGRRLASGAGDGTVRLWDAAAGREVLALKPHPAGYAYVAFSSDGRRLASGCGGTPRIWETSVSGEDLRRREIVSMVQGRFDRLGLRSEVLASLQKGSALDTPDREFALQVARTTREHPAQCNHAAWEVVKHPGHDREEYALALRQAQAAVQAEPGNGSYARTAGVAHYRLGEYAKALEVLERSEKLNATKEGSEPTDLAFLAMSRHRLGQTEQAQATLRRLREAMTQPLWDNDAYRQGLLREAEELLQGKGKSPSK